MVVMVGVLMVVMGVVTAVVVGVVVGEVGTSVVLICQKITTQRSVQENQKLHSMKHVSLVIRTWTLT